ncbi:UDP-Glycosyltransferase/glycogen phosphorylase, partial [Marasmius fiardii PR-910]
TILFFTNSEYGQANVVLGVAYQLAMTSNCNVHIASFPALQRRVEKLQANIPRKGAITFHTIAGISFEEAFGRRGYDAHSLLHPSGMSGAVHSLRPAGLGLVPWVVEEYHEQITSIQSIMEKVSPGLVVSEFLLFGAQDVCRMKKQKMVILTPNSIKDAVGFRQPWLKGFWKYPCLSTGYPSPVPLHLIPANLYVTFQMIYTMVTHPHLKAIDHLRKERYGLSNPIMDAFSPDIPYLLPGTPETDFPGLIPTHNLTCCGPILTPSFKSIKDDDPELKTWLDSSERPRTVLINLGSHVISNAEAAKQIAIGIRLMLSDSEEGGKVQFLWKLLPEPESRKALKEVISEEMEKGIVKVVDWLEVEPRVILGHPNVVCSVHHGGANSYFEAVDAGVPHIVLPCWYDTYEYANRVETLKIGVWGSRQSAPYANGVEFGNALKSVLLSRNFGPLQSNAAALSAKVNEHGGGRKVAAERILELAR